MKYLITEDIAEGDFDLVWFKHRKEVAVDSREKAIELADKMFGDNHGEHFIYRVRSVPDDYRTRKGWRIIDEVDLKCSICLEVRKGNTTTQVHKITSSDSFLLYENLNKSPKKIFEKILGKEQAKQYFCKDVLLIVTFYGSFGDEPIELECNASWGTEKNIFRRNYRKEFVL